MQTFMSTVVVRISTAVSRLLSARRPSHVARFVVSVVVDAVQRVKGRRLLANMREKAGEVIQPLGANTDSSAPIVLVMRALVIAALFHSVPSSIFWRSAMTPSGAVLQTDCHRSSCGVLISLTPAGASTSTRFQQRRAVNDGVGATHATTTEASNAALLKDAPAAPPVNAVLDARCGALDYCQQSEFIANRYWRAVTPWHR